MRRIAFVFSGQGDQFPGMGKDVYEKYPEAKEVFDTLEDLQPGLKELCFFGTSDDLKDTKNTQPCLYALENAYLEILKNYNISPLSAAGFSLGEVAAARCAGVFSLKDGFKIVSARGKLMAESAEDDTFMAAVLKLSEEKLEEICSRFNNIYPVNFNCPGQISVSGKIAEREEFLKEVKEAGGRAVPIKVKGAFHSPFMDDASEKFGEELKKFTLSQPSIPLYSNITGEIYKEDILSQLKSQINHPVRWEKLIRNMISDGIDTFIEIGPGKTLTNMIKKINKDIEAYSVSYLDEILEKVKTC